MKKLALILPYFGKFPNYFQLFLKSCKFNNKIDFLIFTDQNCDMYYLSENIIIHEISLEQLSEITMSIPEIGFPISSPYKLCDFKPAYGKIFENYLKKYEYWGFCDCDLIFGDLTPILKLLDKNYDKVLSAGHLSIIKNSNDMNILFSKKNDKIINFIDAIKIKEPCFFDEIWYPKLCSVYNKLTYYDREIYADILPQHLLFKMPHFNLKNQSFFWNNGILKRLNDNKEFIYLHLQKRKMIVNSKIDENTTKMYIYPNTFEIEEYSNKISMYNIIKYHFIYTLNNLKKISIMKLIVKAKVIMWKVKK